MRDGPERKQLWLSQEARRMPVGVCQADEAWTWMEAWARNDKDDGCVRTGLPEPEHPQVDADASDVSIFLYVINAERSP